MKHKIILMVLTFYLIASLAFAQVDKATGTLTNDATQARLRLAHFVYGSENVDWLVNGEVAVNGGQAQVNIPVGFITGYLYLSPETYSVAVVPTGKAMDESLLGPLEVDAKAGHRYTIVMIGQVEDKKLSSLLIDETAELEKVRISADQNILFLVNNLAGTQTIDLDQDGRGPRGVVYGGVGVAPLQVGRYKYVAITADGDPNILIDSGGYSGYGERPADDVLIGYSGRFPGALGEDFDVWNSSPVSDLNTIYFLQSFSDAGFESDYQAATFDTFLAAVKTAGLTDLLITGGPYLVWPPTDEAFAALPKDQLDALMADPKALGNLVRNHIIEGYVPRGSTSKTPGGILDRSFTNLLGTTMTVGDGYTINGANVDGGIGSMYVSNGTQIHQITKVLLPLSQ
jgi:uncharacterized surface protein with fasciclin (FAS1) repeats